jgi:hypothetical protein
MVRRAQTFAQIVMPERAASEHREITERLSKLGKLESTQLYPLLFFCWRTVAGWIWTLNG